MWAEVTVSDPSLQWAGITVTDRVLCAMCEQESLWLCTVCNVWAGITVTVYCVQCVSRNRCDWQCNVWTGITVTDCVQCVSRNYCDWLCTVCNVWAGITVTDCVLCNVWAGITVTDCVLCAMSEQESLWLTVYCVQCVSRNQCGWLCTVCNVWAGINVAGVKWVIRLQLVLLLVLFLSAMDLLVGSFVHTDPGRSIRLTSISVCLSDSCLCLCDIFLYVTSLCLTSVWHLSLYACLSHICLCQSVRQAVWWCVCVICFMSVWLFFLVSLTSVFHYSDYLWLTWCSANFMPSGCFVVVEWTWLVMDAKSSTQLCLSVDNTHTHTHRAMPVKQQYHAFMMRLTCACRGWRDWVPWNQLRQQLGAGLCRGGRVLLHLRSLLRNGDRHSGGHQHVRRSAWPLLQYTPWNTSCFGSGVSSWGVHKSWH